MAKIRWICPPCLGLLAALVLQLPTAAQTAAGPRNRIAEVIDDRVTVARPLDIYPMARPEYDQGEASPDTPMERMVLVLAPGAEQQKELNELTATQQDRESPEYHRWLTPEAFGSRFGVSAADLDQIVDWLKTHGFEVEPVSPARRSIIFSGSVAQVAAAFHTAIHVYNVGGERHLANAGAPEIPMALAEVVLGIVSLHDFRAQPMYRAAGPITRGQASPAWLGGDGNDYLAPADFATIYDASSLYTKSIDGTGQSIAIVGRTNINVSDVQTFRSLMGLPANNPIVVVNGPNPGILSGGEEGEAVLDVEWSGAVARKAAIKLVVSQSTNTTDGVTLSAQYIVNKNLAPIVSVSFSECEIAMGAAGSQFWNGLWQQASVQGMTVLVSSGDSGAAGCDADSADVSTNPQSVNGLCSSPFSTCVGGTEFSADRANPSAYWTAAGSALGYIPEAAWNESGMAGGSGLWSTGGGPSMYYPKPAWQAGPGVPADGWRDVPDVALSAAAHDGYLTYMTGSYWADSGTSAAAPSFAGLMALAAQHTAGRLGSVNSTLYQLAANQAEGGGAVFHDVITGNNSVPGLDGFSAGIGYDLTTGLGSVDAAQLIDHWGDAPIPGGWFEMSASPVSFSWLQGASVTAAIQLTVGGGFNAQVALSASGLPSGLTASFSPATVPAGSTASTLTLTAGAQAATGANSVTIVAAGGGVSRTQTIAVNISSTCTDAINPTFTFLAPAAGNYTVAVTAPIGCSWTAVSDSDWLTIAGGGSGSANGSFSYSVTANAGTASRSGNIAVGGVTMAVTQVALPPPFALNPLNANYGAAAATGIVVVTAASHDAHWSAVSNAPWITVTIGATNTGSQSIAYSVAANPTTAARSGTMAVAGLTFTVTQAAAAAGFTLSAVPSLLTIAAGSSATIGISVAGTAGFQGNVALSVSGLPTGVTAALTPAAAATGGMAILTLTATASAPPFSGNITLGGTSGSLTGTFPLGVTVPPATGFTLSANPAMVALVAGSSATTAVSVAAIGNFTGSVTLAASGLPAGVTARFVPAAVAPGNSATLTLAAVPAAASSSGNVTLTGVSGPAKSAWPLGLSVTAFGFTLRASPSPVNVAAGSSVTTTVSVAGTGGFTGTVTLAASGLPAGITAAFSPAAVAVGGTSTLTLTAAASARVSSANFTLSGVSGSQRSTAQAGLTVTAAPGFTLSATPSPVGLVAGSSATALVGVAATGNFTDSVTLAVSGLPAGVTAAFNPTVAAAGGSSTLTLTAAASAAVSSATLTVSGTDGNLTGQLPLRLNVTSNGFTLSANPSSLALVAGSSATTSVSITAIGSFKGKPAMSVVGLPAGVTATFVPAAAAGTYTLTLKAAASAAATSANLTITGGIGSLSSTTPLILTVTAAPGFTLAATASSLTVAAGSSTATTVSIMGTNGFAGNVTLAASGLPAGVTAAFVPASAAAGGSSTLTLTASASAAVSVAKVTVKGTSGSATGTTPVSLAVTAAPGFTVTAPPAFTVAAGASASTSINIGSKGGFQGSVTLAVSGLPAGISAALTPVSAPAGSTATLTLTADASAAVSSANLTVTGVSGPLTVTAPIRVSVTVAPGFTLKTATPSLTVGFNLSVSTTVSVLPVGGFTGRVTLGASGLPCGVTAVFTPPAVQAGASVSMKLTSYYGSVITTNIVVTGTSGGLSATTRLSLTSITSFVGFTLSASPTFVDLQPGGTATTTIRMQPVLGYTGQATLSVPDNILPPGVTATISPSMIGPNGKATLTIKASASAPVPTGHLLLQGSVVNAASGNVAITLNNDVPGFSLEPPYIPDQTLTGIIETGVTIDYSGGFSGPVDLSFSGLPPGVIGSFQEFPGGNNVSNQRFVGFELAAGVTAVASPSTPVTIAATSGDLTASVTFNIAVEPTSIFSVNPPAAFYSDSDYFTTPVGGTAILTILGIGPGQGFTVSVSGAPPDATTTITPAPPSEYAVSIATTNQTAPGCYVIDYVGTAPGQPPYTEGWPLYLTVTQ